MESLKTSEKMLFKLIEEMPVGVIVHNKSREILKANKVAAGQYSYLNEAEMKGKIFPESSLSGDNDYYSKNLGGSFNPEQFVIIKERNRRTRSVQKQHPGDVSWRRSYNGDTD